MGNDGEGFSVSGAPVKEVGRDVVLAMGVEPDAGAQAEFKAKNPQTQTENPCHIGVLQNNPSNTYVYQVKHFELFPRTALPVLRLPSLGSGS